MKRPVRVLYPFVGDTIGGSHLSALALMGALNPDKFQPLIVVHEPGCLTHYLQERGICYRPAPRVPVVGSGRLHRRVIGAARCASKLAPFLINNGIDVVHTNDGRMHLSWGLAARCAGSRFLWHQRTLKPMGREELFAGLANAIVTVSDHCRESFRGRARRRAQTVLNPVAPAGPMPDRTASRARLLAELDAPETARLVAFVGNLREQKRPLVFIDAAASLKESFGTDLRCLLFGEEREPAAAQVRARIAERGLEQTCILMQSRFPIEPFLAGCDLLLAPAVNEGFGRTLVEAMLVGTAVVASRSGGHSAIINDGETGVLVPPDDPKALAEAALRLLHDPQRTAAIVNRARVYAAETYSVERHADIIQQVYLDLLR